MIIRFRNLTSRMGEVGEPVKYHPGEKIIMQGHNNFSFFLILSGHVGVYSGGQEKVHLAHLSPGEYFGELSCLTGEAPSSTYAAVDSVELMKTGREGLLKLMSDLPDLNRHIIETLCCMIRQESCNFSAAPLSPEETGGGDGLTDAPSLAVRFLAEMAGDYGTPGKYLSPEALEKLKEPGLFSNAGELREAVERAAILSLGPEIDESMFTAKKQPHPGRPLVGLALGAGVVRGMAHIGVIRSLKRNGIPVDMAAGTSAGALVGACLASGVSVDSMDKFARELSWSRVAAPVIPPGKAFLNNEKLGVLLDRIIGGKDFSQLQIPLAVVAADACTGEEVVIREGRVSDAVRASTAIPAIFEPVKLFNRTLVDGATVNMVPASVCRAMGADIVIAVSVCDFSFESGPPRNIIMAILRYTDLMLKKQVMLAKNQWADIVISVERPDLAGHSFREARHFIREGERVTDRMIPRIKAIMGAWRG